ncbi:MAG TPA: hypothetical protein VLJ18_08200 [Thermoanaerobaculia bacterium]|nr:hypothetical protein [Thermoanaerobaculia bacterium]
MKRILFAPSLIVALGLATLLVAAGLGAFSLKGEEGPPAGKADAKTGTPSSTANDAPPQGAASAGTAAAAAATSSSSSSPSKKSSSSSSSILSFSTTADKTSVSLGDRVVVTYAARIPAGATLTLDALVTPAPAGGARPPGGAVLEFENPAPPTLTKSKTGDFLEWSQSVALFPFAAGAITVPGPHYTFEESFSDRKFDVRPQDLELTVTSRLPPGQKPEQLAPKADKPVRIPAWPAKYWIALAAGVALVAALVAWLVLRRRRTTASATASAPALSPSEELRLALARLAATAENLGDDARAFYSELTYAVKRFLERVTGDPVLEWTTFETVRRLREKGFEFPREAAFPDLLASADRVKFGKGAATREDARDALVKARVVLHDVEARQKAEAARAAAAKERAS